MCTCFGVCPNAEITTISKLIKKRRMVKFNAWQRSKKDEVFKYIMSVGQGGIKPMTFCVQAYKMSLV